MNEKLPVGPYLRLLRSAKGYALRKVEEKTGVSNAFLSQLESGKVKQPSPFILYKLAELYEIPYETLMERAGYPVPSGRTSTPNTTLAMFYRLGKVTEKEEEELLDYLPFLRLRAKKEGRKK